MAILYWIASLLLSESMVEVLGRLMEKSQLAAILFISWTKTGPLTRSSAWRRRSSLRRRSCSSWFCWRADIMLRMDGSPSSEWARS